MTTQNSPIDLTKPFIIGNINVDPQNALLTNDQQPISCEPKVFELLIYFCTHAEQLRTRDQLLTDLWQGRVVSDNAINRKIYQLRKILQTLDNSIEYIETVPKRGYRLAHLPETTSNNTIAETTNTASLNPPNNHTSRNQWWLIPLMLLLIIIWAEQLREEDNPPSPQLTPITSLQGTEKYPAMSSDNRLLTFSHSPNGKSHYLKQFNLDTKSQQNITLNKQGVHDIKSQWHPTENQLAFIRLSGQNCAIYLIVFNNQTTPSKPQKIIDCNNANLPTISWGADKNQLFIAERARKTLPYQLYSINIKTGAKKQLTNTDNQGNTKGFYYIQRNTTGNKLVSLFYLSSNKVQVNTYRSHDFSLINSFELEAHIDSIAWQPNDEAFYFKQGQYIEKVDDQGKNRTRVFHVGQDFADLNFSYDGQKLLFSSKAIITNIYQYDIDKDSSEAVISSTKQDKRPAMANTSQNMAFISNRSGSNQFWLINENQQTKPLKALPFDLNHSNFAWSPDDQQLVFEHQDQIYLYDVNTGHHCPIITKEHQAYYANWSFDGKQIIYSSNKTGNWQLWQFNLSNKSHKQLTTNGGYTGQTDQNGQLYFSKYHHNGLYRLNQDGSENQLIADFSLLNWLNWQLKGETIYYAKLWGEITKQSAGIYTYHIKTGHKKHIMAIQPKQMHDYTIANDASFIRYTRLEAQAGDILMLDLHPQDTN